MKFQLALIIALSTAGSLVAPSTAPTHAQMWGYGASGPPDYVTNPSVVLPGPVFTWTPPAAVPFEPAPSYALPVLQQYEPPVFPSIVMPPPVIDSWPARATVIVPGVRTNDSYLTPQPLDLSPGWRVPGPQDSIIGPGLYPSPWSN